MPRTITAGFPILQTSTHFLPDLCVLFVVSPYVVSAGDEMMFRSMADLIEEYGFDYLDTNLYYEEMELNFSKDFYNDYHVNPYGAEKFTCFLSKYLADHYHIKDRRWEKGLEKWEQEVQACLDYEKVVKSTVDSLILQGGVLE